MIENVPLGDIKVDQRPTRPLDVSNYQHNRAPILILEDGTLVDGLWRLRHAEARGKKTIAAVRATNLGDAISNLELVREGIMSPARIYQIHTSLADLYSQYSFQVRGRPRNPERESESGYVIEGGYLGSARSFWTRAYGTSSWHNVIQLERELALDPTNQRLMDAVKQLEAGEIKPSTAYKRGIRQYYKVPFRGSVDKKTDQQRLLRSVTDQLGSVVTALSKLGLPLQGDVEDLQQIHDELFQHRSKISQLLILIRKRVNDGR